MRKRGWTAKVVGQSLTEQGPSFWPPRNEGLSQLYIYVKQRVLSLSAHLQEFIVVSFPRGPSPFSLHLVNES